MSWAVLRAQFLPLKQPWAVRAVPVLWAHLQCCSLSWEWKGLLLAFGHGNRRVAARIQVQAPFSQVEFAEFHGGDPSSHRGVQPAQREQELRVLGEGASEAEEGAGGAAGCSWQGLCMQDMEGPGRCRDLACGGMEFQVMGTVTVSAQNSGRNAQVCAAKLLQEETGGVQRQSCV